jgi:hypothetical protein
MSLLKASKKLKSTIEKSITEDLNNHLADLLFLNKKLVW